MSELTDSNTSQSSTQMDQWFEGMINSLNVDYLQLQTNTANDKKKKMYASFIEGRQTDIVLNMRNSSSEFFVGELVRKYIEELHSRKVDVNELAFDLSDAKVLVWVEINENDDGSEDSLILAEAKTNAHFSKYGFHVSSTIVESSDDLAKPPHYKSILK